MGKSELSAKIVDILKKIVPPINDIVNDDQFRDGLTKAGGFISLVAVGLDAYDRLHKSLETDEAKGLNSLNKCLLATTEEVLREISARYLKNEEINIDEDFDKKKETIDELFKSFKEGYYDDGIFYFFPYRFPPVRMFKSKIKSKLEKYQNNKEIIEFFDKKFEPKLKIKINNNDNIKTFLTRIKAEQQEGQNIDYLQRFLEYTIERSSLKNYYYVGKRQAVLAGIHTWNWTNKKIEEKEKEYVIKKDAEEIINDFIENEYQTKRYMYIAAPFGTGKSFLIKKISSDYATKFLQNESQYIPIVVYLGKTGLKRVNEDDDIDKVLKRITTADSNEVFDRKILLIFDGLDEYKGKLSDLMAEINSKMEKYTFHKVILTTRPLSNLPEELGIEKYVRLLPFTKEQVNEFFGQTNTKLTYEGAKESGLNEEEITKPLLAWMLSQIPAITEDLGRLKLSEITLTGNETKSLIYLHFFHHIIAGKPVDPTKGEDENIIKRRYIGERKGLRKIASLKQIHNENKITLEDCKKAFPDEDDPKGSPVLNQIFKSYFYIEGDGNEEKTITFEHNTYRDYLISEYYLEYFLKKDKEDTEDAMNIGVPSTTTLEFLEGLIGLLKSEDHNIKKLLEYDKDNISLLNSLEYREGLDKAKEQIKNTALNLINKQVNSSINYNKIGEIEKLDGVDLSIDKWISLYILNILIPGKLSQEINKKILSKLIREINPKIPSDCKKLKQLDLSGEDLAGADLDQADLSNTKLDHAYLGRVKLSKANLSGADLNHANLNDADLSGADLSGANLNHADLNDADLSGADLTCANLTDADLSDATLKGSILMEADLTDADLSASKMMESILIGATLSYANFWRANLSNAKLTSSKLEYTQLTRAILSDADLTCANLSYATLMKAHMNNAKLINANFANAFLYGANLSGSDLSHVDLSNAHLPHVNFSDSNLSNACLDNTTLSHVDLSRCNLTSSKMTNITKYDNLICRDSNFNGSSIDSQAIIKYLHNNRALNVPSQTSFTSNNCIEN